MNDPTIIEQINLIRTLIDLPFFTMHLHILKLFNNQAKTTLLRLALYTSQYITNKLNFITYLSDKVSMARQMEDPFRIDYIEGARGLAAFCVFLDHIAFMYGNPSTWFGTGIVGTVLDMMANGPVPVSIFYIMSGFVLSRKYFLDKNLEPPTGSKYTAFALSRLTRLYIPYLVAVFLSIAFKELFFVVRNTDPSLGQDGLSRWVFDLTWTKFFIDIFFQNDPVGPAFLPQAWFLPLEICFNLMLPFMVWIVMKRTRNLVFLSLTMIILLASSTSLLYFVAGVIASQYHPELKKLQPKVDRLFMIPLGLFSLSWANFEVFAKPAGYPAWAELPYDIARAIALPGLVGMGFILFSSKRLQNFLSFRGFQMFGKISYSFYLTHWMVVITMSGYLIELLKAKGMTNNQSVVILGTGIMFAVALTLSIIFYFIVERPCHKLAREIGKSASI